MRDAKEVLRQKWLLGRSHREGGIKQTRAGGTTPVRIGDLGAAMLTTVVIDATKKG